MFSRIRTEYNLSVFNPNAGKYGPEKNPYLDTFHAVISTGLDQFSVGYDNIVTLISKGNKISQTF